MPTLTETGNKLVQDIAHRHGVSIDAATHMFFAVSNGQGTMAQFNHYEFGGAGQWMSGGMTMVSDLFNTQLKYRVDSICADIAGELRNYQSTPLVGSFQSQSQNGQTQANYSNPPQSGSNSLFVADLSTTWWPADLGAPNATGSQNQAKYAYFSQARRLAVQTANDVWVYDTQDHQIGGFSQQQGYGGSITFTSQYGVVQLSSLPVVSINGVLQNATPVQNTPVNHSNVNSSDSAVQAPQAGGEPSAINSSQNLSVSTTKMEGSTSPELNASGSQQADAFNNGSTNTNTAGVRANNGAAPAASNGIMIIATLDRLGGLREKGIITEEEFQAKKAELLNKL